jgi:hypothetical protein
VGQYPRPRPSPRTAQGEEAQSAKGVTNGIGIAQHVAASRLIPASSMFLNQQRPDHRPHDEPEGSVRFPAI